MSLDFKLFPMDPQIEGVLASVGHIYHRTVLEFSSGAYLEAAQFHHIDEFPAPTIVPTPFPDGVTLVVPHEGGEYEVTRDGYFNDRLSFVTASQLRGFVVNEKHPHHVAIKAYLDALPDDFRIVLWWE